MNDFNLDPENPIRAFKGVWIPAEIWEHEGISLREQILWTEIKFLDGDHGCYASNSYLLKKLRLKNNSHIRSMISHLKELGLVYCNENEDGTGKTRRILHANDPVRKPTPPAGKTAPPPLEKPLHTILLNNQVITSKEVNKVLTEPVISQSSFSRKKPVTQLPKEKPTKKKKEYPIVPEDHPSWELLFLWNKHPACPTIHKLTPNSGLINHIKGFYDELTNGIFFRGKSFRFQDCSNFFEKKTNEQMIQWEKEGKKFSHNEIIGGLRKAMLNYIKGYSPSDKESLPQSLSDLFYLEYFGISLFIDAIVNPPKQLKDTITIKEIDPDLTNEILDAAGAERTPANVKKANEFIRLTKTHWDITTDTYNVNGQGRDFYKQHPSWYMFVVRYIEWMQDNAWPSKIDIGCFDVVGGVLRTWYDYLRKEYSDEDCDFKILKSL